MWQIFLRFYNIPNACFLRGLRTTLGKKTKKWHLQWDSTEGGARRAGAKRRQPTESEQSHFLTTAKNSKAKRKSSGGENSFSKANACFLRGLRTTLGKKTKKWHLQWEFF